MIILTFQALKEQVTQKDAELARRASAADDEVN